MSFLCFGDAVYLADGKDAVVEADGYGTELHLGIAKAKRKSVPRRAFANVAVYTIWQQLTAVAARALREAEDGTDDQSTQRDSGTASIEAM